MVIATKILTMKEKHKKQQAKNFKFVRINNYKEDFDIFKSYE